MARKAVSPSEEIITAGQAAKFYDLFMARLRKSGLPIEPTQYVLENEGVAVINAFEAEVRRRVVARRRVSEPHLLRRREYHDPKNFIQLGSGVVEQVGQRSGDILDAGKIVPNDYLRQGESCISGKERLRRIKAAPEDTQLDFRDFRALLSKRCATLKWLYDTKGISFLSFWGEILNYQFRSYEPHECCVFYVKRRDNGSWGWSWIKVDDATWGASMPAAVLTSK